MIFVAGHKGLVGSSILDILKKNKKKKIILRDKKKLNLENFRQVDLFFKKNKIKTVYMCAAKVGGIFANNKYPYNFISSNISIQNNIINACLKYKVRNVLFFGSSCIYPKNCKQPIKEEYLMSNILESTNRPYAVAKIAGVEMIWACNRQFHTNYICIMPTNLYGPNDNFDSLNSHVIPGIIRKIHDAQIKKKKEVTFWGTGKPMREFLFSYDLAKIAIKLLNINSKKKLKSIHKIGSPPLINVGSGVEISIKKLCRSICNIMNFKGKIKFDPNYPDGTMRKKLDSRKLNKIIKFKNKTNLYKGLKITINNFLKINNNH